MLYVVLIALLNLGMGFALAVYLGRRRSPSGGPAGVLTGCPPGEVFLAAAETTQAEMTETHTSDAEGLESTPHLAGDIAGETTGYEYEDETKSQPQGASSSSEASAVELQDHVRRYEQALVEIARDLRSAETPTEAEWLEGRLRSLHQANEEYLKKRNAACEAFESLHQPAQEFGAIRDTMQDAVDRQSHHIQETNEAIDRTSYEDGLDETRRQMTDQANQLIEINHQVRDVVDETMLGLARGQQRLQSISPSERTDPVTGICNRAGLEAALEQWWSKDPHRVRQLAVAMIDIDHFRQVNEQYGQFFGDEILRAIAQLLAMEVRGEMTVARYRGQTFAVLFPDSDVRRATGAVEKVRQVVETTLFQTRSHDARVTVSCGLTEAAANDASDTLFARLETTVQEAKRYGRNRTFVHDGKYPTPVVPPNFTLEQRTVVL